MIGANNQYSIVAGNGPNDFIPVFVVDPQRDGLRASGSRDEDQLVLRLLDLEAKTGQDLANGGQIVFDVISGAIAVGQSVTIGSLVKTQLVNVAGERGLGHVEATAHQFAAQLILAADVCCRQQFADCAVSVVFGHKKIKPRTEIQAAR